MSKRDNPRVLLTDYKDEKRKEGLIEIDAGDGNIFTIEPPELWPDEIFTAIDDGPVAMATALIGEDRYEAFLAVGGSASMVNDLVEKRHGDKLGGSSASSSS